MVTMSMAEVEELPWQEVESSNIERVAWLPAQVVGEEFADNTLGWEYVAFISAAMPRIYRYEKVKVHLHREMVEAESVGSFFSRQIKPVHACERIQVRD